MPKTKEKVKKGKGKGKKNEKDKPKENKEKPKEEIGPKLPTEKELLEMQIEELKEELGVANREMEHRRKALEDIRQLYDKEVESKLSCVGHLKRVLQRENEGRVAIQQQLQKELDLAELEDKKALEKLEVLDHNSEVAKSEFLQQKNELEMKLSQLDGLRLERNSQKSRLKILETDLNTKVLTTERKLREEDINQVNKLLKNREVFMQMCNDIRMKWREAFNLKLPVFVMKQLEENVRLRNVYHTTTDYLLQVQEKNRTLKKQQKSLELEEEIQSSIEYSTEKKMACQEKRLKRLLKVSEDIQSAAEESENLISSSYTNEDTLFLEKTSSELTQDFCSKENALTSRIDSIRTHEIEQCRLKDKFHDMNLILEDQMNYKTSIELDIQANIDRNGTLISAILRAGKILQTRSGKLGQEEDFDYDMLNQIRSLLDLEPGNG